MPMDMSRAAMPRDGIHSHPIDTLSRTSDASAHHLLRGVDAHGHVQEGLVEEGHARLQAPREGRLVRAHHVKLVQPLNQRHGLPGAAAQPGLLICSNKQGRRNKEWMQPPGKRQHLLDTAQQTPSYSSISYWILLSFKNAENGSM